MRRSYVSAMVQVGDGPDIRPVLCDVYSGTWESDPGPTEDTLTVSANVTDEQHAAILSVDGVSEVAL